MNLNDALDYIESKHGKDWYELPDEHPDVIFLREIANDGKKRPKKSERTITEEDKHYVKLNYQTETIKEMTDHLGITRTKLYEIMDELNVRKTNVRMGRHVEKWSEEGKLIQTYASISEAARENNVATSGIARACGNENFRAVGFKRTYAEKENKP